MTPSNPKINTQSSQSNTSNGDSSTSLQELISKAKSDLQSLTGFPPESVISIKEQEDGNWKLIVEALERSSIPDKMDILGCYELLVKPSGSIISYERSSLRKRGDTSGPETTDESS
jgi:hypothetical protein